MSDLTSRDFRRTEHHEFYKLLRDVAPYGSQAFHSIFTDFLTLAHAALFQPVNKLLTGKINDELEAEYLRTIGKYDKERAKNFSAGLAILINTMEKDRQSGSDHDFLGDVYGCITETQSQCKCGAHGLPPPAHCSRTAGPKVTSNLYQPRHRNPAKCISHSPHEKIHRQSLDVLFRDFNAQGLPDPALQRRLDVMRLPRLDSSHRRQR